MGSIVVRDPDMSPSPPSSPPQPQQTLTFPPMDESASPPPSPQPSACLLKPVAKSRALRRRSSCTPSAHSSVKARSTSQPRRARRDSISPDSDDDLRMREGTPTPEGTPPPDTPPASTASVELHLSSSPPIEHREEPTWSPGPRRLVLRLPKPQAPTLPPPMPILLCRAINAAIEAVERIAEDGADVARKTQVLCAAVEMLGTAGPVGTRRGHRDDAVRAHVGPGESALYAVACRILVGTIEAALCSYVTGSAPVQRSSSLDRRRRDWWAAQPRWHSALLIDATAGAPSPATDPRAARADLRLVARRTIRLWHRADTEYVAVEIARRTDAPLPSRRAVGALVASLTTVMDELLERTWPIGA